MITQTKTQTRNNMLFLGLGLLLLICAVGGGLWWKSAHQQSSVTVINKTIDKTGPTATQVAAMATDAVVYIEVGWKIFHGDSGRQLSHVYLANAVARPQDQEAKRRVDDPSDYLPTFINYKGKLVPMLSTESGVAGGNSSTCRSAKNTAGRDQASW